MKEVKSTGAWVPRQMFCPNCGTLNTAYEQDKVPFALIPFLAGGVMAAFFI